MPFRYILEYFHGEFGCIVEFLQAARRLPASVATLPVDSTIFILTCISDLQVLGSE